MMQKQIKERPILFSGEMVRAILDGKKTQTRRVITPQPTLTDMGDFDWKNDNISLLSTRCPYGREGDYLWVRETWTPMCKAADPYCACETDEQTSRNHYFEYRADTEDAYPGQWSDADKDELSADYVPRWKPSIHMPRQASRITLEIVNVRVERVKQITDDDALAEGVDRTNASVAGYPRERFKRLWDSINAKRGYAWDANPWVWVVEFKKL